MAERRETMAELLGIAAQLPAVRTKTDPAEAANAALTVAEVWYTGLESKKSPSDTKSRGQAGGKSRKPRGK